MIDGGCEFRREKLVGFVHDEGLSRGEIGNALASEIEDAAGGADQYVDRFAQPDDIVFETCTSSGDHDVDPEVLPQGFADLRSLQGQFPCWHEDECLDVAVLGIDSLEDGYYEGSGFACAIFGACQNVAAGEGDGDRFFLNGRGLFEASFKDTHHELSFDIEIFEFEAFGCSDILCLYSSVFGGFLQACLPILAGSRVLEGSSLQFVYQLR